MEIDVVLFGIERSEVVDVTCMDSCRAYQHSVITNSHTEGRKAVDMRRPRLVI